MSIEQLGANTSFVNSLPLKINEKQLLHDGDRISLLENEFIYTVEINEEVKSTLKRRNTDNDEEIVEKKQKIVAETNDEDEDEDEGRLAWIQQQLNALQSSTTTSTTTSSPIKEVHPTTEDHWETPADGLEVFTSKGVVSRDKVSCFSLSVFQHLFIDI